MEYNIIYANRKSISVSVKKGIVTVRAPYKTPVLIIDNFVKRHTSWIEKQIEKTKNDVDVFDNFTKEQIFEIKKAAREYFKEKTEYYSKIMNLIYGRITITGAKTRFGSCSSKGNISYSYRLMLYPKRAREYVVVHELAHIAEMNHSKRFYDVIEKVLPDHKERRRLLK